MFLEYILEVERNLFLTLNGVQHPLLDGFFYLISAKWTWVIMSIAFLFFLFYKKPTKEALFIVGAVLLSVLICINSPLLFSSLSSQDSALRTTLILSTM